MPGFLCFQNHFYMASQANEPCPTCKNPANQRLDAPDEAGPMVVPTDYYDEQVAFDVNGQRVVVRIPRVEPMAGSPWVACTDPVWSFREGHHGIGFRFECHRLPQAAMRDIRASVCNQWIHSDDYKRKQACHPFLQGFDESSGWLLVEFSVSDREACMPMVEHLRGLIEQHLQPAPVPSSRKAKP